MKFCPKCHRNYADKALRFCLDDGTALVSETKPGSPEAQPTLVMPPPQVTRQAKPAPTVAGVDKGKTGSGCALWPMFIGLLAFGLALLLVGGWWLSGHLNSELLYQARHDHTVKMRMLLLLGADVNAKDETESTPLMGAAWRGQTDTVKTLLTHGANPNFRNKAGETALILSAKNGNTEIVRMLIDKNADLNAKDNDGWTCLMWAAWIGNTDTVRLLVSTGVRVSAKNNLGETAQYLARKKNYYALAALINAAE
jgi:hypothetical protein